MALEIFKLVGSIFVDNEKANESISKTDQKAEGLGNKFAKGAKTAAKWGAGIAAAAGAVGTAMIASAKSTAANLDEIDKASQRMSMSAEAYQKLAYAADLSGVSMSQLESANKKLKATMGQDADLTTYLKDLASIEDETERNAAAAEIFGKSAQDLIPLLNAGADGIEGMMTEAEQLGVVMSNDTVKAGAEMNDTFTKIETAIGALKNGIGAELMPIVNEVLNWVLDHMPQIQEFVRTAIEYTKKAIEELKPIIKALLPVIENIFKALKPLWENFLKPILMGIITFLDGVFSGNWKKIFEGLGTIVKKVFEGMVELVKIPINAIIKLLNKAIDGFNAIQIPDWVPLVGGKGLNIPQIPMLAEGGTITKAGTVMVGERGAELLNLPVGAQVTPLDKVTTNIDYDRLAQAIAGEFAKLKMTEIVKVVPDESKLFKVVQAQARTYEETTGNFAF